MSALNELEEQEAVRQAVREGYGQIARNESSCCGPSCCGGTAPDQAELLAQAVGYQAEELKDMPEGANMGLSCGNPVALASLRPGEAVLDLGSGGGFDVFNAGRLVGASGRVIGIDMTSDMLQKARRNVSSYQESSGLDNVEFRLGEIEHLPVADDSVDVVISNCVINLSPDKPQVWKEIARVLKPGGRVSVSDLALLQPLPDQVAQMIEALVGCVAGAVLVDETRRLAQQAGLAEIGLEEKTNYIEAMQSWEDPMYRKIIEALPEGGHISDYVTSLNIEARKPRE